MSRIWIAVIVAAVAANVGFFAGQATRSSSADAAKAAKVTAVKDAAVLNMLSSIRDHLSSVDSHTARLGQDIRSTCEALASDSLKCAFTP